MKWWHDSVQKAQFIHTVQEQHFLSFTKDVHETSTLTSDLKKNEQGNKHISYINYNIKEQLPLNSSLPGNYYKLYYTSNIIVWG